MAPNSATSEVIEANEKTLDRTKNPPELLMTELPLRGAGEGESVPGATHSLPAVLAAPQNRHKIAASWMSSAQNEHFTVSSLSCPPLWFPQPSAVLGGPTTSSFLGISCTDDAESLPIAWLDAR